MEKLRGFIQSEKVYSIIAVILLIIGLFAWDLFRGEDLPTNGITADRVEKQLRTVESQQQSVTDSIERIDSGLRNAQTTAGSITTGISEASATNSRIIERNRTIQEIINSNTRSLERSERIFSDIQQTGKERNTQN